MTDTLKSLLAEMIEPDRVMVDGGERPDFCHHCSPKVGQNIYDAATRHAHHRDCLYIRSLNALGEPPVPTEPRTDTVTAGYLRKLAEDMKVGTAPSGVMRMLVAPIILNLAHLAETHSPLTEDTEIK